MAMPQLRRAGHSPFIDVTEAAIRASAVRGELTPYEAAWRILELRRPGRVSAAHPDDQDEAREIAESITRERVNR